MVVKTTTRKVKVLELKEKAVSKKQQRFFGMVRAAQKGEGAASPEVAKVAGEISKKDAKDFAKTKHKGLPEKKKIDEKFGQWKQAVKNRDKAHRKSIGKTKPPKQGSIKSRVKKGVGRVPLKDVNTPAEKQSMQGVGGFRGVHGSNRKSKAAQGKPAPVVYSYKKKVSEGLSVKDAKKLNKAAALDQSNDPKDQDRARARRTEVDYKDLLRQINKRKKPMKPALESFEIDKSAHKKAQKKSKMRNLAKGNTNPNEKAAAEKKAGGPKLYGEGVGDAVKKGLKRHKDAVEKKKIKNRKAVPYAALAAEYQPEGEMIEGKTFDAWKKAASNALKRKKEERKPQKAQDAGARAKRLLQRKEYASKVSGSTENVPDEMRD